ncbi:hypothetical protein ILYODFUR_026606 [Ilyodon furcidens]|uniref:Uncharacterized protein n=1 Tax=Ilyodon furcidens TaxID=33524 RepID=A0ABV0UVE2_9TELE
MGSGTSRGKKVAPACVSEVTRAGGAGLHPSQQARGPFNQRKVQGRHSEGPHSECSGEDDDTLRGDNTDGRGASPRRTFIWSKTRGLCPFSREDTEDETSSSPQLDEPRVPRRGQQDVNKRSNCVFTHRKPHTPAGVIQRHPSTQKFSVGGTFLESVPTCNKQQTFGSCHSPSLPMPVILYDGSEEELMDTIEREFS